MNPNQNQPSGGQQPYQPPQQPYVPPQQAAPGNYAPSYQSPQANYDTLPTPNMAGHTTGHNPYEFIVNANAPKQSALNTVRNDHFLRKVILIIVAVIAVFVVGGVAITKLKPTKDNVTPMVGLAEEQQELIRIADLGVTQANNQSTNNLAITIRDSLTTNQTAVITYVNSQGTKLPAKMLSIKKNSKTDDLLAAAQSTNTYDSAIVQILTDQLATYAADIKTAYGQVGGSNAKALLDKDYSVAVILLTQSKALNATYGAPSS